MPDTIQSVFDNPSLLSELKSIADKVFNHERISFDEGVILFEKGELGFLGSLANFVREHKNGNNTYHP